MVSAEDLIESMDNASIDMSIACGFAWSHAELCRESNDYIMESVARYPERLIGLAVIKPEDGRDSIDELERCLRGGLRGLGELRPHPTTIDIAFDNIWTPIVKTLAEHRSVCLFHASEPVGHAYPGKEVITPEVLYPFIARHPKLRVLLAHWGGGMPFYGLMPEVKKVLSNTWFDSAASSYLYDATIYRQVADLMGEDRILFGSDYPLMPQSRALAEIRRLSLKTTAEAAILGGNAAGLFGL